MNRINLKQIIVQGIALGLPLAVFAYVIIHFVRVFEKVISPTAKKIGVESLFGEITLTVLACIFLLVLTFFLGLLMQLSFVARTGKIMEEMIFKMMPSFNHLKLLAVEKLATTGAETNWKPVLVELRGAFVPAYLVEESAGLATFSKVKTPGTEPGDIVIIKKETARYIEISMSQLLHCNKQFGKGYISLIEK